VRPVTLLLYLAVLVAGAAGGGYVYLKWSAPRNALKVTVTGEVRYKSAGAGKWIPSPERVLAGEKDHFEVASGGTLQIGDETFGEGNYEVARGDDGEMALFSSTTRSQDWQPREPAQGSVDLVNGEAELAALRREVTPHLKPVELLPVKELMSMKGVEMEFQDFDVMLLEPPSGRRLAPGADIWLHWTPVPFDDVKYSVEIAHSMQFEGVRPRPSQSNRLTVRLGDRGLYFWRVRASRRGRTTYSKAFSFEVK